MIFIIIGALFILFFNYAVFRVSGMCSRIEEREEDE